MQPEALSVSQIRLYLSCSLKYRYQHLDKLPRVGRPASLLFDSAMHAALEWLHKARRQGRQPPLEEIHRVFVGDWHAQTLGHSLIFTDRDDAEAMVRDGKDLLAEFYQEVQPPVKEAALPFQMPFVDPETGETLGRPFRGVIDLVEGDETVDEFRTALTGRPATDLSDNLALTAAAWAFETLFGHAPRALRLITLVRTPHPRIEVQTASRTSRDVERLFQVAKAVLKSIRSSAFIPNRGCWLCKDCPFDPDCRLWSGNAEQ